MKQRKQIVAVALAVMMAGSVLGVAQAADEEEDVITCLLPPVSSDYQEKIYVWAEEYEEEHPNITIEISVASWEDFDQKLDTQVNAGSPPDVSFIATDATATYVDLGMAIDLTEYLDEDQLADFNQPILEYFGVGDGIYGMPVYGNPRGLGANREMLEAAGIDWESIMENGWTYDEFRDAIAAGTIYDEDGNVETYGFIHACSGVTAEDYFLIFVKNAGMPSAFDEDLKYTYTSPMMLDFLEDVRALIDDGSCPDYMNSIDAGTRWNMFLTGQAMMFGKGIGSLERNARENNALIEAGEGDEVEGSIIIDYLYLPIPVFENGTENYTPAIDGYICLTGETDPDPVHVKNVVDFAYYLASGERAADIDNDQLCVPVCDSASEALDQMENVEEKNEYNVMSVEKMLENVAPARPDIPASLNAQSNQILDEVIIPKFQAVLGGTVTPQEAYDAICEAGYAAFGEDGCVTE